jgi:hypothetical protein
MAPPVWFTPPAEIDNLAVRAVPSCTFAAPPFSINESSSIVGTPSVQFVAVNHEPGDWGARCQRLVAADADAAAQAAMQSIAVAHIDRGRIRKQAIEQIMGTASKVKVSN